MDNNASIESLSIEIEGTANESVSSIQDLIKTLNSLQISLDNVIDSSKNFKELKNNLSNASSSINKMNKNAAGNKTNTSRTTNNKSGIKDLIGSSAKSLLALAGINKSWSSLTRYFEEASGYAESMNLYMVTMGENAQKGLKWIKEYSDALYLDPSNVMQYMGAFNSLTKGLGVGAENSYLMSKNLTQLTYDLASFKNLDVESAFKKIQSGISGELEPLRNVGIALSQATLQELAYSLGIEKNVADMTEAQKAQLRYIQIIRQSSEWQTDMAKTLMSPANATRILRQQFTLLARAIGNVLIPIVMTVIPYVMVLTQWLTKLANKLASVLEKLFGIKLDFNYDREITGLGGIADGITDIGDAAGKSAKKLNTMLAPFDDLNVVQNEMDKNGGGIGDLLSGGDLGVALPEYDALAGLTDKFRANMDKAEKNLKRILPIIGAIGVAFAGWKLASIISKLSAFGPLGSVGSGLLYSSEQAEKLNSRFKTILGVLMVGGGSFLFFKSMKDYMNDIGDETLNLERMFGGLTTAAGGLLVMGHPLAAAITELSGGIVILGSKISKDLNKPLYETVDILERSTWDKFKDKLGITKDLSEETKAKVKPLDEAIESTVQTLDNLYLKKDIISDADVRKLEEKTIKLKETILNQLDDDRNKELKNLKPLKSYVDPETYQKMVDNINNFYDKQKKAIEDNESKIAEIRNKAASENRNLTESEYKEINNIIREQTKIGLKNATESGQDLNLLVTKINNNTTAITLKTAEKILKTSVDTKNDMIKNAKEQYTKVKEEAKKMKEAGSITKTEYDEIVNTAKTTRDETIKAAETQYNDVYSAIEKKLPEISKYVDKETGKQKSTWQSFWESITGQTNESVNDITESIIGSSGGGHSSGSGKHGKKSLSSAFSGIGNIVQNSVRDFTNNINGLNTSTNDALSNVSRTINNWNPPNIKLPHFDWSFESISGPGVVGGLIVPNLKVNWYAEGGYPTSGDLFFANENGIPEMVGRIGNKTAVANQDQITTAITNAVLQGITQSGVNNQSKSPTTIYIGNKKVYEGYGDYVSGENDRYGTNMIRI